MLFRSARPNYRGKLCSPQLGRAGCQQWQPQKKERAEEAGTTVSIEYSLEMPVILPEEEAAPKAGEQSKNFLKRAEAVKNKLASLRGSRKTNLNLGWLARDPSEWIGRKIRHRLNGKVFVVRNTFPNGRVELEKSWMMYLSFVWTVRAEYETYSA